MKRIKLKQLQRFQLLFISGSIGFSMLVTYLFGLILGLAIVIASYIGVIVYIRRREAKLLKSLGFRDSDSDDNLNNWPHVNINSNDSSSNRSKPTYVCLVCGRKVSGRICSKCGSRMKKVVF